MIILRRQVGDGQWGARCQVEESKKKIWHLLPSMSRGSENATQRQHQEISCQSPAPLDGRAALGSSGDLMQPYVV